MKPSLARVGGFLFTIAHVISFCVHDCGCLMAQISPPADERPFVKAAFKAEFRGEFDAAIDLRGQAMEIERGYSNANHRLTAISASLRELALLAEQKPDFVQATQFHQQRQTLLSRSVGSRNPMTVSAARDAQRCRDFASRSEVEQQALAQGRRHARTARSLLDRFQHKAALDRAERLQKAWQPVLTEDHPLTLYGKQILAVACQRNGQTERALELIDQAYCGFKEKQGPLDPATLSALGDKAKILFDNNRLLQTRELLVEAIEALIQQPDTRPVELGWFYFRQGNVDLRLGNFASAAASFEKARTLFDTAYGDVSPEVAMCFSGLLSVYNKMGNLKQANECGLQAEKRLADWRNYPHPRPGVYIPSLRIGTLGMLSRNLRQMRPSSKRLKQSLAYIQRATVQSGAVFGKQSVEYADYVRETGMAYMFLGQVEAAEENLTHGYDIYMKATGGDGPERLRFLRDLATFYRNSRNFDQAIECYTQIRDINSKNADYGAAYRFGDNFMLAYTFLITGNKAQALVDFQRAYECLAGIPTPELMDLGEATAVSYAIQLKNAAHGILQCLDSDKNSDEEARLAFDYVWRTKGLVTRAMARHARRGRSPIHSATEHAPSAHVDVFAAPLQQPLENLLASLSENTAVIEFVRTVNWLPPRRFESIRVSVQYEAFVVRRRGERPRLQRVSLGPAENIDLLIEQWRNELGINGQRGVRLRNAPAKGLPYPERQLRELIWGPIQPMLQDCSLVIICPDSKLARLPWAALPGSDGHHYLIEQLAIGMAPSVRAVLEKHSAPKPVGRGLTLVGDVDYEAASQTGGSSVAAIAPWRNHVDLQWKPLQHTHDEIEGIAALYAGKPIWRLSGQAATESALRSQIRNARFVHLATHGFAFSNQTLIENRIQGEPTGQTEQPNDWKPPAYYDNSPLHLSGVVLAGANRLPSKDTSQDDGLLTGKEIVGWDLSHIELITLSACESGLGQGAQGDGQFGIQKALLIAGARSTLTSIWKVRDDKTAEFMKHFYLKLWRDDLGKAEALRQTQLNMIRKGEPPSHWAAWVLTGDGR